MATTLNDGDTLNSMAIHFIRHQKNIPDYNRSQ